MPLKPWRALPPYAPEVKTISVVQARRSGGRLLVTVGELPIGNEPKKR
jgi:hypothetical protein